jgi:hypothetical protein
MPDQKKGKYSSRQLTIDDGESLAATGNKLK